MDGDYLLVKVLMDVPIPELKLSLEGQDIKVRKIKNNDNVEPVDLGPVSLALLMAQFRRNRDIELAVEGPIRKAERELLEHNFLWLRFREHYSNLIRQVEEDPYIIKSMKEAMIERFYLHWLTENLKSCKYPEMIYNG